MPVNIELAEEQWRRYAHMRDNGHNDFIAKAAKCESFFAGDQWEQTDLDALKQQRRPALTINKIISTLGTMMGEQIFNRNETLFRPSTGASAETAEAITKLWKQIAQNNQLTWTRSELFCDGIIRGRGFVDVRLDFTDSMTGEVRITNLNSKNVFIDPDAEEYDPDSWADVIISKWLSPQDVAVLYNEEDAKLLTNRAVANDTYGYDSLEIFRDRFGGARTFVTNDTTENDAPLRRTIRVLDRQYRKIDKFEHFVDLQTGDTRAIPQTWDRNKIASVLEKTQGRLSIIKKLAKRIRWTVSADNIVLHDEWSPYNHFTTVPYFPYFRYGRTIGLVENLIGSQELLNKTSSQELHIVNTTANSGWKLKAGALTNMSIEELEQKGATTGLVLELDDITSAEKITPNATPSGLDRISYKAEEHIKSISNVSDYQTGNAREDVSAKAVALNTQRGSVNQSKVMDNLERSDYLLARNVLDIVQEYYTEPRIVNITHDDLLRDPEQIAVNQIDEVTGAIANDLTIGEYDILITSTPYRATLEDSQFEQAMAMREAGVQIPDDVLIENSRLMRKSEIVKRMQGDQNSPEAQKRKELEMRQQEAGVRLVEAEVMQKESDGRLKQATTEKTLAEVGQTGGDSPEKQAAEMQLEQQKAEQEMSLEERKFQHEMSMMEREMEMKRQEKQQDLALKADMHQHQKNIQQQQADAQAAAVEADAVRNEVSNKPYPKGDE